MSRRAKDDGETLIEMVLSIGILGICVVAIGAGIALSIKVSSIHRAQSTASAFLHNYAEALQNQYTQCTSSASPNYTQGLAAPTAFATPTATIRYWDTTTNTFASTTCPAAGDPGLQQVTLSLASTDGFVKESVVVVLRSTS